MAGMDTFVEGLDDLASSKAPGVEKHTLNIRLNAENWDKFQIVRKTIRESLGKKMTNEQIGVYLVDEMYSTIVEGESEDF